MSRFGRQKRTQADKRAAAVQFVTLSAKSDADKVASLVASYGMTQPQAWDFLREQKARMLKSGVRI